MLQEPNEKIVPEDPIRSLTEGVAELKLSIAEKPPSDNIADAIARADESLRRGEISEQMMVEFISGDQNSFSASSYMAAITLAKWSRRPDVVLPYLGRIIKWFFDSGLPNECHEMMREIFAAMTLFGRVRSLGFDEDNGVMTSLKFHDQGEEPEAEEEEKEEDSHRLSWRPPTAPRFPTEE